MTRDLLAGVNSPEAWNRLQTAVKNLAQTPSWETFQELKKLCGGFAMPITFLSFYDPERFPMVDQRIGKWWLQRFPDKPQFGWNADRTVINQNKKSWEAY